jgi:hypothetical protein
MPDHGATRSMPAVWLARCHHVLEAVAPRVAVLESNEANFGKVDVTPFGVAARHRTFAPVKRTLSR